MKISRLLAAPAIAGAALLTMTGCFQLPGPTTPTTAPATTAPATSAPETSDGGGGGTEATDVAGTTWTGSTDVQPDLEFTLNEDGTVDFATWGTQSFDSPADVWSGDSASFTMTITQIVEEGSSNPPLDITYSGSISGGSMDLTGEGTDGNTYALQATQS